MKVFAFSARTTKEILRDPINLFFGLGFPIILLGLLTAIQSNIPVDMFELNALTPGITVFGLAFMTLFSATIVAKDRESAFLQRLYTTPLKAWDFIFGYILSILPIAIGQSVVCYLFALCLGLDIAVGIIYALLFIPIVSLFFIGLGVLFGSILSVKAVGGICGALITNLTAWLSGVWFDLELVGGAFTKIANVLPFVHAVRMEQALLAGNFAAIFPHFYWVFVYTLLAILGAILLFLRQMKKN